MRVIVVCLVSLAVAAGAAPDAAGQGPSLVDAVAAQDAAPRSRRCSRAAST